MNQKILLLVIVVILVGISLSFISLDTPESPPGETTTRQTTPTPPPNSLGYGQIITTPPPSVRVNNQPVVASSVWQYTVLPAPFEYFGMEATQSIAQRFGFTESAIASLQGELISYREGVKTLLLHPEAGTIQLSTDSRALQSTATETFDVNLARTKAKLLLESINLTIPIINWGNASLQNYTLIDGEPRETNLQSETYFYELRPTLTVGNIPLVPPFEYYARFDVNGEMISFSYWMPNLDYDNAKLIDIIPPSAARQKIEQGQAAFVRGRDKLSDRLEFDEMTLVYLTQPGAIYNLDKTQKLIPTYKLENDDVLIYVDARGDDSSNQ